MGYRNKKKTRFEIKTIYYRYYSKLKARLIKNRGN
jgi:hypothetical protein